jgi:hypothetical protein
MAASASAADASPTSCNGAPVTGEISVEMPPSAKSIVTQSLSNPRRSSQSVTAALNAASSVSAACT